jgi:alpha-glucoside transport system substrate-binding protein
MISGMRRRRLATLSFAAGLALVLAACGDDNGDDDTGTDTPEDGTEETDEPAADGECAFAEPYGDLSGTSVTVFTTITDPGEIEPLEATWDAFEECTGATIVYEGTDEFEAQLPVRLAGGTAPDIAFIPQPGLLAQLVNDFPDAVVPASDAVKANVEASFDPSWVDYGTVDGTYYAAPFDANVKSFVWYSPSAFADAGYEVPETWDELLALSDQIVADGSVPWCAGVGSGDATGWPATDWVEDVMLRTAGADVYDQWFTHEIPFNDPQVVEAIDTAGEILKNDEYVNGGLGGVDSIATTRFEDGGLPILDGNCWMHRQASFYVSFWGEGVEIGEDGDVFAFYFPPIAEEHGSPVLGGGSFVGGFSDRNEVEQFRTYLASDHWHEQLAATGNFVSPNTTVPLDTYSDPIIGLSAEMLQAEDAVFRFDASDLMPGAVGGQAFWTGMVNWLTGSSTQEVADTIEDTWAGLE